MLSKESSNTINYLKCILCLGVVLIHSQFVPDQSALLGGGNFIDAHWFNEFRIVFVDLFLDHTCVPLFFLVSGYLFFLKFDHEQAKAVLKKKITSRFRSLLMPYLIANTIYLIVSTMVAFKSGTISKDTLNYLSAYWNYNQGLPADAPLWFLRDLILLSVLSPLIYFLLRKLGIVTIFTLTILWITDIWIPNVGLRGSSTLFFCIGAFLSLKQVDIIDVLKIQRFHILYILLYVILLALSYITKNDVILNVSILSSFPVWISFASFMAMSIKKTCPVFFVTGTFFVFMYHYTIALVPPRILLYILGTTAPMQFVAYFIGTGITIVSIFILYTILSKYLPKTTSILLGGRN